MKFNIGDHLQEIDSNNHGIVIKYDKQNFRLFHSFQPGLSKRGQTKRGQTWYLLENDELGLINHWTPESKLKLHKQVLRDLKLKQLGIKYN